MSALVKARKEALAAIVDDIAKDDAALVKASGEARRLDSVWQGMALLQESDATIEAHGWTREELRIAVHASKPAKDAPMYLTQAHERHKQRHKQAEGGIVADHVQINVQQNNSFSAEQLAAAPIIDLVKG